MMFDLSGPDLPGLRMYSGAGPLILKDPGARMEIMLKDIDETAEFLFSKAGMHPRIGMITGTGLGGLTEHIDGTLRIPYPEIPHFPSSTTMGHSGMLLFGTVSGKEVVAMEGRFHLYEGYHIREVTFPVRVMARLGIRTLFISSAAGGLNPLFRPGDLMVVSDHINLMGRNPLSGPNLDAFGPRFPDMSHVYDPELISIAEEKALTLGMPLRKGIYAGIPGPSLETPAETRFLRMIGADAVGMSTVPEVIVGVHCGLRIMAIVAITNVNLPDCMASTSIEEVVARAQKAGPPLAGLWDEVAAGLPDTETSTLQGDDNATF